MRSCEEFEHLKNGFLYRGTLRRLTFSAKGYNSSSASPPPPLGREIPRGDGGGGAGTLLPFLEPIGVKENQNREQCVPLKSSTIMDTGRNRGFGGSFKEIPLERQVLLG